MVEVDGDGAAVARDDLVGDREPEPAAALVPAARLVDPREPFEDAPGLLGGDAGAVIGDGEHDPDRSTVVATGLTVTVPAGTFADCSETEDHDPIDDVTEHKFYCAGVGLVREVFPAGGSLDLVERDTA
jgi:hypothetical protein